MKFVPVQTDSSTKGSRIRTVEVVFLYASEKSGFREKFNLKGFLLSGF